MGECFSFYNFKKLFIESYIYLFFIKYGADVESSDNQGRNALAYARIANSMECIQLLLNNGSTDNTNNIIANNQINTLNRKSHSSTSTSHITLINNNVNINKPINNNIS